MKISKSTILTLLFSLFWVPLAFAQDSSPKELDEYIALADDSYNWELVEKNTASDKKTWLVELTSQTWHGITWKHYMYIVEPAKLTLPNHSLLFITGSSIGKKPGAGDRTMCELLAEVSGTTVAMLFQVPNQPLFGNYVEDALIGETLLKAIETNDSTWPLLFPMAKSAVKAMDATQEIVKQETEREIKGFVVSGASKRGWTTWLTGASKDKRVVAIAPIVIDTLNIREQMKYQLETWGKYSDSIHDYTERNLVQDADGDLTEYKKRLWSMVDPYSYRTRLDMPKLLIHGTNDPYWTVDATKNYWDDLVGVKYILTLPNAGHGLDDQKIKAFQTLAAFTRFACVKNDWPKMDWKREDGKIFVRSQIPASAVKLWIAESDTKDFRKAIWTSREIKLEKPDSGNCSVEIPKANIDKHVAYFVELETKHDDIPCSFTTQVWRD